MKGEIKKYLDFVFQDFPETDEVIEEKERLLKHMEEVHTQRLSEGVSKLDAMEDALDAVGDIRELHRKFGKKNPRRHTPSW